MWSGSWTGQDRGYLEDWVWAGPLVVSLLHGAVRLHISKTSSKYQGASAQLSLAFSS